MTEPPRLNRSREQEFSEDELTRQAPQRRSNWTLWIGVTILLGITLLAIFGPKIAPRDPLEENFIIKIGDQWETPPFRIFTEGFPLGSDQFGRDLWSRLLWGIRPTLILVIIVGSIRLILGVLIGLFAGWSDNRLGRLLNDLIEFAVSIPVLLVALGAIALIGPEYGIWAFIIGLSLTGWVETSQQVREQTRIIKKQTFVEAARALGSNSKQILGGHVIRQILPMIMMLFAFELSSTLMTTAGLGFLGYYVGGDVWVEVSDFVARRTSGTPELGQMLATSWVILTQPWGMVAVGSTIFITVLGFNLVGEGLRAGMNLNIVRRRSFLSQFQFKTGMWLDEHVYHPLSQVISHPLVRAIMIVAIFLALFWFGGVQFLYPRIRTFVEESAHSNAALAIAVESPTPEDQGPDTTPTSELTSGNETIIEPSIFLEIDNPNRFVTGLAFSPTDGQIYVASQNNMLNAYDLDGNLVWETQLPETSYEAIPIVDSQGTVYIADRKAGITAISSSGEILWHFISDLAPNTVAAPVLSVDGTLYYVVSNFASGYIQAVSNSGENLWNTTSEASNFYFPLSISLDGRFLFHREDVIDTQTQEHLKIEQDIMVQRYIGGLDGNNYLLAGQNLIGVDFRKEPPELLETTSWDASGGSSIIVNPQSTPSYLSIESDGSVRMMYTTPGGSTISYWLQVEGKIHGAAMVRLSGSGIQAFNQQSDMFLCGGRAFQQEILTCALMKKELEEEAWKINLGGNGPALGGFEHDDHFYFSTASGKIYVIGEVEVTQNGDVTQPEPPQEPGIVWSFPYGNALDFGPGVSDDGTVFLIDNDYILTTLNPDGTQKYSGDIPKPWLIFSDGQGFTTVVYPFLLQDRLIILAEDNSVYALDSDGNIGWEYQLEFQPVHYPTVTPQAIYITDLDGSLYAFDQEGLSWIYQPDAPMAPTGSLGIDSDGNIYYGLTDGGNGYIHALTKDGQPIWRIQTRTGFFYDPLEIAGNGDYLFLNDDIYLSASGELVEVEFPFPIDDLIAGEDGKFYLRTGNSILQWQLGGEEAEILHTAPIDQFVTTPFFPFVRVSEQGILWIYKFRGNQFGVTWVDVDGNVVGEFSQKQGEILTDVQDNPIKISVCTHSAESLSCGWVDPITQKYSETAIIQGVDKFLPSNLVSSGDGYLYILSTDRNLIKIYLGD